MLIRTISSLADPTHFVAIRCDGCTESFLIPVRQHALSVKEYKEMGEGVFLCGSCKAPDHKRQEIIGNYRDFVLIEKKPQGEIGAILEARKGSGLSLRGTAVFPDNYESMADAMTDLKRVIDEMLDD